VMRPPLHQHSKATKGRIDTRLAELGIALAPAPRAARGAHQDGEDRRRIIVRVRSASVLERRTSLRRKVGREFDLAAAQAAARLSALNVLAHARAVYACLRSGVPRKLHGLVIEDQPQRRRRRVRFTKTLSLQSS